MAPALLIGRRVAFFQHVLQVIGHVPIGQHAHRIITKLEFAAKPQIDKAVLFLPRLRRLVLILQHVFHLVTPYGQSVHLMELRREMLSLHYQAVVSEVIRF